MIEQGQPEELQTLRRENAELREQLKQLQQQLDWFKRQLFGRKSEKLVIESPEQFGLDFSDGDEEPLLMEPTAQISYSRRRKRRDGSVTDEGLRFDETVPVEVVNIAAPELKGKDADAYEVIAEKVTHRLAQRPGSYFIREYHRPVVKHIESQQIKTTPAPAAVLERSFADESFLAGLLVDKFVYHLPLYRQHQRLADCGITLSRSTLANYVHRSIDLLKPIYDAQWRHILESRVLAIDETPVKAGRKKEKRKRPGQMKITFYWPVYGEDDEACFTWSKTRGAAHIEQILEDFKGVLLSDGYSAYDSYARNRPEVTQAQCWAHARRYFERAKESDPAALQAMAMIKAIYQVEADIRARTLDRERTMQQRCRHAKPHIEELLRWCRTERLRSDLMDKDLLTRALNYTLGHEEELQVYLGDPDVPIDNNHLERTLRVIPKGRKNWIFCWTEVGAELVGIVQSLLSTCRLHGVNPFSYLVDVLQRIADQPASRVEELTPRRWKELFAQNPLQSHLGSAEA